jgi:hypothetical protein
MSRAGSTAPGGKAGSGLREVGKPNCPGAALKLKNPVGPASAQLALMLACTSE